MSTENLMRREYQRDREPALRQRPERYVFQEFPKYITPPSGGDPVLVHSAEEERAITGASAVVSPSEPAASAPKPARLNKAEAQNTVIYALTGRIIRAARALLGWTP